MLVVDSAEYLIRALGHTKLAKLRAGAVDATNASRPCRSKCRTIGVVRSRWRPFQTNFIHIPHAAVSDHCGSLCTFDHGDLDIETS